MVMADMPQPTTVSEDGATLHTRRGDVPYRFGVKIGRANAQAVALNIWTVEMLAEEHGVGQFFSYVDQGVYFELHTGEMDAEGFPKPTRFLEGGYYVETADGPRYMSAEAFNQVAPASE